MPRRLSGMSFWHDLRHGVRLLRKAPLFAIGSVSVLALAIGSATAIFSLVDAALIRPLPFRDPGQLVMIWERLPRAARNRVAGLNFVDWSEQSRSFSGMAATMGGGGMQPLIVNDSEVPEMVPVQRVSPTFFDVLGVKAIAGRTFIADDLPAGADLRPGVQSDVAIISERLWRTRFGADPAMVGRTIRVGTAGQSRRVIGVVPASFQLLGAGEIWTTTPDLRMAARRLHFLQVIGRLTPGVTIGQARSELGAIADRIAREAPETNKDAGVTIEPLQAAIVGDELTTTSLVLGGMVTFVLLLACANIANLILARGVGRVREIAVRAAIGGRRRRIVRQLVTENLVLGMAGGAAGLALSWAVLRAAPAMIPARTIPESIVLGLDWRLSLFAVGITLVTAVLVGLIPAWRAVHVPLAEAMTAGGRGSTDRSGRLRTVLAAIEVAAALLLLVGAGLFVRTLMRLNERDPGYRAEHVITMAIGRSGGVVPQEVLAPFYQAIEREVSAVPGVRIVSFVSNVPLDGQNDNQPFTIAGDPPVERMRQPNAHYQIVSPRYFEALGITLLQGRGFTGRDMATTVPVCIINEELARRFFAGRDPIGARISIPSIAVRVPVEREIVGVIRQVAVEPVETERAMQIYVPLAQNAWQSSMMAVRTEGDPVQLVPSIKAAIARADRYQAAWRVRTMEQVASDATSRPRFRAQLVGVFASLAAMLAAIGIFSVLMFTVQQRAREFGIRTALGARAGDIFRLVLGGALRLTGAGLAIGLIASFLLVRSLTTLLFGIEPFDLLAFAAATIGVGAVALAACLAPALRAMRADPAHALRAE